LKINELLHSKGGNVLKDISSKEDIMLEDYQKLGRVSVKARIRALKGFEAEDINVKGLLESDGKIICKNVVNVKGEILGDEIDCQVMELHGKIRVKKLNSDKVKIISSRGSTINHIISKDVFLVNGSSAKRDEDIMKAIVDKIGINLNVGSVKEGKTFKVDLIESDNVELENVHVKKLVGINVKLRNKCKIEYLNCKGKLEISDDSIVINKV